MNFRGLEARFGEMYHLILDLKGTSDGVRFVAEHDFPKFASIDYHPIFFDSEKNFRIATDYTIIYPKVYVRHSIPVVRNHLPLERCQIQ